MSTFALKLLKVKPFLSYRSTCLVVMNVVYWTQMNCRWQQRLSVTSEHML